MDSSSLKETIKAFLGPWYPPIRDYLIGPIWGMVTGIWSNPNYYFFWVYLTSSLLVALLVFVAQQGKNGRLSLAGFLRFCAPREVFAHKSAVVDYKFFVVNAVVNRIIFGASLLGSVVLFSSYFKSLLQALFGQDGLGWESSAASRAVFTLLSVVVFDLGFTLGHYLQHKIPFLWEFHKVHHSTEVLTPLSNYRFHPIDTQVEHLFTAMFSGILTGTVGYLYSKDVIELTVINVNVVFFVYYLTANLRHSHIWLSYGRLLNHVISSPAMHQIHHSSDEKHFDKNYALVFSFWDWLLGSLYVPREKETLNLGLSNQEHQGYDSVWNLYALPFKKGYALLKGRRAIAAGIGHSE